MKGMDVNDSCKQAVAHIKLSYLSDLGYFVSNVIVFCEIGSEP